LASIAGDLRGTQLEQWQQEEILRNHVLDFPEFREISIFDAGNRLRATSRLGTSTLKIPSAVETQNGTALDYYVAAPYMDADALPTTTMAVPLVGASDEPGWIIAEISLEELWRTVDRIKVGTKGYALLLDEDGNLVAHGNPDDKTLIALRAAARPRRRRWRTTRASRPRPRMRQSSTIRVPERNSWSSLPPSTIPSGRCSSSSRPTTPLRCPGTSRSSCLPRLASRCLAR
jgi:hypothetical protein